MTAATEKILLGSLVIAALLVALVYFLALGPPGLYARSESPEFCGSCHILQPEYEAWFHSGAHRSIKCIDCHLPNDNLVQHLLAKTIEGVKDGLAFHTGWFPENLKLSQHGAQVVLANCRRCHSETVARINEDRRCWECHRRLSHRLAGAIETGL